VVEDTVAESMETAEEEAVVEDNAVEDEAAISQAPHKQSTKVCVLHSEIMCLTMVNEVQQTRCEQHGRR
jgi:hypothetical protein